jgi:hypothetical protein
MKRKSVLPVKKLALVLGKRSNEGSLVGFLYKEQAYRELSNGFKFMRPDQATDAFNMMLGGFTVAHKDEDFPQLFVSALSDQQKEQLWDYLKSHVEITYESERATVDEKLIAYFELCPVFDEYVED